MNPFYGLHLQLDKTEFFVLSHLLAQGVFKQFHSLHKGNKLNEFKNIYAKINLGTDASEIYKKRERRPLPVARTATLTF